MSDIILGASLGGLAALIVSVPAIAIEIIKHGKVANLPLVIDVKSLFEWRLSQLASFALGVLLHILMGMFFGAFYPFFADNGWLNFIDHSYSPFSLLFYSLIVWLVFVLILFPLVGLGWFGQKEGKMVWLEVLVALFLIAVLFELAVPWFQPVYFSLWEVGSSL